jgi:hypothetical protein
MHAIETGFSVRRIRNILGMARCLLVLVDGKEVGSVSDGGREFFPLEPGTYQVQVSMDWCVSRPCEVVIWPLEITKLEAGVHLGGFRWAILAAFTLPHLVFIVRPARPFPLVREIVGGILGLAGLLVTLALITRIIR